MSQINFTRKTFLEKEEIARLQEFLRDSPSENAIIGNTSKYGILRTDFENDTDFLVEPSSNAGRVKIAKQENKAITIDGNRIYQEAIDNIEVPDDNLWYWMRIKYKYVTYEKGTVSINSSGEVVGNGTSFLEVLRGQGTNVPTKVKFLKLDGTPAINSGFYEVVDVLNNQNLILTSAVDFVAESDLRLVVLGTTPLGEMLSAEQQEGLYKYDSCEIEFIPEDVEDSETPPHRSMVNPDTTYEEGKMFYIARVKNNAGFVDVDNDNPNVRADFWEFNVVGLTDKLSRFANLSDVQNADTALSNLGVTTVGRNIVKGNPPPVVTYLRINANGTSSFLQLPEFATGLDRYLKNLYLNRTKNLSDLLDVPLARENLGVYGKAELLSAPVFQPIVEIINDVSDNPDLAPTTNIVFSQYGNLVVVTGELRFSALAGGTILNIPEEIGFPLNTCQAFAIQSSGNSALLTFNTDGTIVLVSAASASARHHINMSYITDTFQ